MLLEGEACYRDRKKWLISLWTAESRGAAEAPALFGSDHRTGTGEPKHALLPPFYRLGFFSLYCRTT